MKKTISAIILTIALICSFALSASAVYQEESFNAVKGTPIIDGKLDDIYTYGDKHIYANYYNVANSGTEDAVAARATGFGYICWDEGNIYTYIEIVDPTKVLTATESGSTDAVERTFDFDSINAEGTTVDTYGPNGLFVKVCPYAEKFGLTNFISQWLDGNFFSEYTDWMQTADSGYKVATTITETGYTMENKFPLFPDNAALKDGYKEGFSFGYSLCILDDIDDDGKRDIKISWGTNEKVPAAGENIANSAACDKIVLIAAPVIPEEVVEDDTASSGNPGTSDNMNFEIMIFYGIFSLLLGMTVISKKIALKK